MTARCTPLSTATRCSWCSTPNMLGELAGNGKDIKEQDPQFADQVEWMKYVVAKSNAKWKFVAFHKGPYSAGDNAGEWEDDRVQFYKKVLVPAFDEMGIDMVFEAHDHMYMRSYQMLDDKVVPTSQITYDAEGNAVNPKGTVYLMSNALGDKFYTKYPGYNDYFAAIDAQPNKKMFTDVSVSGDVLKMKAYTAAKKDEKPGDNGVKLYDQYGIKRTDTKSTKVQNASVQQSGGKAVLSWKAPSSGSEPVRGFRIYEKNGKIKPYWNAYVKAEAKQNRLQLFGRKHQGIGNLRVRDPRGRQPNQFRSGRSAVELGEEEIGPNYTNMAKTRGLRPGFFRASASVDVIYGCVPTAEEAALRASSSFSQRYSFPAARRSGYSAALHTMPQVRSIRSSCSGRTAVPSGWGHNTDQGTRAHPMPLLT